jgi:hypothetical protein
VYNGLLGSMANTQAHSLCIMWPVMGCSAAEVGARLNHDSENVPTAPACSSADDVRPGGLAQCSDELAAVRPGSYALHVREAEHLA